MLKAEEQMELVVLKKHGESLRSLSRTTGRSRNTVRRYVRGGEAACTRKPAPKRAGKLYAFKQYIIDRLAAAVPDRIPANGVAARDPRAWLQRRHLAAEGVRARFGAGPDGRACGALRD